MAVRWSGVRRDAPVMLPAALGSAGVGVVSAANPAAGAGIGSLTVFLLLPWGTMFAAFAASAVANRWGADVGGITIRAAEALLVPFAIRAYGMAGSARWPRWSTPEWLLALFIVLQFFTSYFDAQIR